MIPSARLNETAKGWINVVAGLMKFMADVSAGLGSDPTQRVELGAVGRNLAGEDIGDDARPAVDEINPPILDAQAARFFPGTGLIEEH